MNLEKIEKAFTRLKLLNDALDFKAKSFEETSKDSEGKVTKKWRHELRRGPLFMMLLDTKEEAEELAATLNTANAPIIQKEFERFEEQVRTKDLQPTQES